MRTVRIALIGDFNPNITAHRAINESMRLAEASCHLQTATAQQQMSSHELSVRFEGHWLRTSIIQLRDAQAFAGFHGIWCAPGSPYENTDGALWAIEWARTRGVPFLGTCGGFQHALLEFVRHVLGRRDAAHAEIDPKTSVPLIAPLACTLVEKSQRIIPTGRGRFIQWYGAMLRAEGFHCSFGLNPTCETWLKNSGLEIVARDETGEVRAVELREHKFFVGTLFQPERAALAGQLHPLVQAFVRTAADQLP